MGKMFNAYDNTPLKQYKVCHVYSTETSLWRIGCDERGEAKWLRRNGSDEGATLTEMLFLGNTCLEKVPLCYRHRG